MLGIESQDFVPGGFLAGPEVTLGTDLGVVVEGASSDEDHAGPVLGQREDWQPQVLQKDRRLPGDDSYGTRLLWPETSLNPSDSVTRTELNAEPVNLRQSGQCQFANISNRPWISYLTAPQ
jgi:hypothetical protein